MCSWQPRHNIVGRHISHSEIPMNSAADHWRQWKKLTKQMSILCTVWVCTPVHHPISICVSTAVLVEYHLPGYIQLGHVNLFGNRIFSDVIDYDAFTPDDRASLVSQTVKKSACNAGDQGSIPGSGRSPGERNGNPPQYPCLGNPMDREAQWVTVHGLIKSQTATEHARTLDDSGPRSKDGHLYEKTETHAGMKADWCDTAAHQGSPRMASYLARIDTWT